MAEELDLILDLGWDNSCKIFGENRVKLYLKSKGINPRFFMASEAASKLYNIVEIHLPPTEPVDFHITDIK
jgi:hypothetical protein